MNLDAENLMAQTNNPPWKETRNKMLQINLADKQYQLKRARYRQQRRENLRRHFLVGRRLRAAWIAENGPCRRCGSSVNLQIDHINPRLKTMSAGHIWLVSDVRRRTELGNCQVLCGRCHGGKTFLDIVNGISAAADVRRKTHCKNGHEYAAVGFYVRIEGGRPHGRRCKACQRDKVARLRQC